MSASISTDVAYVLKNLNEIRSDNQKRKQNFIIQYGENKILDGNIYLSKEESQLQPNVKVENVDNETYRTLVFILCHSFLNIFLRFRLWWIQMHQTVIILSKDLFFIGLLPIFNQIILQIVI